MSHLSHLCDPFTQQVSHVCDSLTKQVGHVSNMCYPLSQQVSPVSDMYDPLIQQVSELPCSTVSETRQHFPSLPTGPRLYRTLPIQAMILLAAVGTF